MIKTYIKQLSVILLVLVAFSSCQLDRLESAQSAADGGGTIDTFTAYTIDSTDPKGSNVYGRIVFWKTELDQTLVQISLYNTIEDTLHPAILVDGLAGVGTTTIMTLDDVDGTTGELATSKFYLITDTTFYDSLAELDAHVSVSLSASDDTIVAIGDIGANADPVDSN